MNHPERINLEECINRILKSVLKALIDKQSFCCWKRAVHHCLVTNWDSVHISTAQIPYFWFESVTYVGPLICAFLIKGTLR